MTTAPILLSFCGESKTGDYEVDSMVMGYDVKNPAIKSALKKNKGNIGILSAFLSKQRTLDLIGKRKKNLYFGYTADEWKHLVAIAPQGGWYSAQGTIEPWNTTYNNFLKWVKGHIVKPPAWAFKNATADQIAADLALTRWVLSKLPLFQAYFNPDYPDVYSEPDNILIDRVNKNQLIWMVISKGDLGNPPLFVDAPDISKNSLLSVNLQSGKVTFNPKQLALPVGVAAAAVTGVALAAVVAGIVGTSKQVTAEKAATAERQAATAQAVANASQIAKPLSKWRIFLKTYFGL